MITEDYVSFETAKLLKEKGFDTECRDYYNIDGHFYSEDFKSDWNNGGGVITIFSAPTLQMATKWLREAHNIYIDVLLLELEDGDYGYVIQDITTRKYLASSGDDSYRSQEDACEAAIKYCLQNLA